MALTDDFLRVSRRRPCPVCERTRWCLVSRDDPENPSKVICARVESPVRWGEAGWLHVLRADGKDSWRRGRTYRVGEAKPPASDRRRQASRYAADGADVLPRLAKTLGVSVRSLHRLGVGWSFRDRFWSWPLCDETGKVRGINRRFPDGSKAVMPGHAIGLYLPVDLPDELTCKRLFIVEGGSDTAAALDLSLNAVGRFSCTTNVVLLRRLVRKRRPASVVVVADADGPGRDGAEWLARSLLLDVATVKLIEPPAADLRAWLADGATHGDVASLIEKTKPMKLQMGKGVSHGD